MPAKVLAFSGSSRTESLNSRLLDLGIAAARAAGAEVTRLDLRELALPIYDGDLETISGLPVGALALRAALREHPALLIASPEYNGFFSPLLKNALDWASRPVASESSPFTGRCAALLAASPGALGGIRGLPALRLLLNNLGVYVQPGQLALGQAGRAFAEDGSLHDPAQQKSLTRIVSELLTMTQALQAAANGNSR